MQMETKEIFRNNTDLDDADPGQTNEDNDEALSWHLQKSLRIHHREAPFHILCDLGYGIPKEARPRKEKILAISKQLVNFLAWQHAFGKRQPIGGGAHERKPAHVEIVSCTDSEAEKAIKERMHDLWNADNTNECFPGNFSFASCSLEEWLRRHTCCSSEKDSTEQESPLYNCSDVVYLSPDAEKPLDPSQPPPRVVVVGLLIDRRTIQFNKSKDRGHNLGLSTARWPLDQIVANISPSEPLNVDCVLEGMQQWEWNCHSSSACTTEQHLMKSCTDAIVQALEHHSERHPERPVHKK